MDRSTLKRRLLDAVEDRADEIITAGEWIWMHPEVGFKEYKTVEYTAGVFKNLGLRVEENIGLTGVLAKVPGREAWPNVAVIGELDALLIPEHPDEDPMTGRFTTRDAQPGYRRDPQFLNPYSYSRNNPHKHSDPTGQFIEPVTGLLLIGGSMLFGYLVTNPLILERLFTTGQSIVGYFSLAPPPTVSASESIEQIREQNWGSYGIYFGTSNPSTVLEQTQNNGITNQGDTQYEQEFQYGWYAFSLFFLASLRLVSRAALSRLTARLMTSM